MNVPTDNVNRIQRKNVGRYCGGTRVKRKRSPVRPRRPDIYIKRATSSQCQSTHNSKHSLIRFNLVPPVFVVRARLFVVRASHLCKLLSAYIKVGGSQTALRKHTCSVLIRVIYLFVTSSIVLLHFARTEGRPRFM